MAGRTTYSHKIDLEIIENQALKKNQDRWESLETF
jgi:hypothetical protein